MTLIKSCSIKKKLLSYEYFHNGIFFGGSGFDFHLNLIELSPESFVQKMQHFKVAYSCIP